MAINTYVLPCLLTDLPRVSLKFGSTLDPANIKENDDVYFECEIEAKPRVHKIEWKFEVRPAPSTNTRALNLELNKTLFL